MPRSSGGIGLKMVEALVNLGLRVTLLVLGAKVMTPLDAEMIAVLHQELRQKGVNLRLQSGMGAITQVGDTQLLQLSLNTGEVLATGMVLLAIGVKPDTQLARSAWLVPGTTRQRSISMSNHSRTYRISKKLSSETVSTRSGRSLIVPQQYKKTPYVQYFHFPKRSP